MYLQTCSWASLSNQPGLIRAFESFTQAQVRQQLDDYLAQLAKDDDTYSAYWVSLEYPALSDKPWPIGTILTSVREGNNEGVIVNILVNTYGQIQPIIGAKFFGSLTDAGKIAGTIAQAFMDGEYEHTTITSIDSDTITPWQAQLKAQNEA